MAQIISFADDGELHFAVLLSALGLTSTSDHRKLFGDVDRAIYFYVEIANRITGIMLLRVRHNISEAYQDEWPLKEKRT